ncbi:MAG: hypothetical protein M1838_001084 [Thelocarpon superellum]|nr:MAG: hypothetical protein M1838_001084 [Thelocarpon superellum]
MEGGPNGIDPLENGATVNGDHAVPDIVTASSLHEIHAALSHLNQQDASVTTRLDQLVAGQKDLSRELGRLDLLRAHLGSQAATSRSISHGMLSEAAVTANRISSAVTRLDLEQSRVRATLDVVEQVAELKVCVLGVTGAMGGAQDWEKAAGYLSRAIKIPQDIVEGSFAEEIVPTAEVPDLPSVTLHNAAESLCGLFMREFAKAAAESDGAKVTRFFKLFPLIGRSDVGLDIYGRYVCQGVASRARANLNAGTGASQRKEGFFYANALTKLFEHIAQIVDGHGSLVERHYGPGRMVKVMERLQKEADVQGGIILETWSDERSIDRKLTDIKSYAFSFLVQSFLSSSRGASNTPRANSPSKRGQGDGRGSNDSQDGVEMKEVDGLLSEAAVMLGRWSLYCRFLADKCKTSNESGHGAEMRLVLPPLLTDSNLIKKVGDRLVSPFSAMTTFFFRRSVEKAFQLDESPPDITLNMSKPLQVNPPFITSAVDDVMYIVNKVLQRTLATSQRHVVAGVVPTIGRVLGSDFVGMIQRKMRDESYPKAVNQGGLPPEDKIVAFLILINNLDVATDYVARIVSGRVDPSTPHADDPSVATPLKDLFPFEHDADFVATSLRSLQLSFESKTSELVADGLHVAFDRVIKPRLRPIISDAFRDTDYSATSTADDETYHSHSHRSPPSPSHDGGHSPNPASDAVQHRFSTSWDLLMKPMRRLLTERSYNKLLASTAGYVSSKILEKRLWAYHGRVSALGALRLERDVAAIVGVVVRGARYGLRDAFARCLQICLVMNLDDDEWDDLMLSPGASAKGTSTTRGGGGRGGLEGTKAEQGKEQEREGGEEEGAGEDTDHIHWVLDPEERRRARAIVGGGATGAGAAVAPGATSTGSSIR